VAVWIHELRCLFGFGVSGGGVSCQPFVARPVNVRMSSHDVAQQSQAGVSEEEHEQEEDCTYAGRASGLYPRL
jgi:hypothetical protein